MIFDAQMRKSGAGYAKCSKTMTDMHEIIRNSITAWPCCKIASVKIVDLYERERGFFDNFMPNASRAIVLLHHVTTEEEWTWYATNDGGEHCAADDHAREICEMIKEKIENAGHDAKLVPYPHESGLQFRFVAQASGLGKIGTNAFLFHPEWGPWAHLRVMGTTAELDLCADSLSGGQICDGCGLCISECPAQAITESTFTGFECRSYRRARGEYDPHGPDGLLPYCMRCIWICPKGPQPLPRREKKEIVEQGAAADANKPRR